MIYYHGSSIEVAKPDTLHSKKHLDFGKGFYVTSVREQAIRWAKRKASFSGKVVGIISIYEMNETEEMCVLDLTDNLDDWIDFVCACRNGSDIYEQYDVIKGKVADDKVFRVVDMYKRGIWNKERTLKEIKVYQTYDQIAFIHQKAIDKMLKYQGCFEVKI